MTIYLFPTEAEAEAAPAHARVYIIGVGMAEAAAATASILASGPVNRVLLAGIAGGRTVGEVVGVLSEEVAGLPMKYQQVYRASWLFPDLRQVRSATVSAVGQGACEIENMEGAAVMAVCQAFNVPCAEVRAISNRIHAPRSDWRIDEALAALKAYLAR